jgi:hypothetical protein
MRYFFACVLTLCLMALAVPVQAEPDVLAGSWSGGGSVQPVDGDKEVVRCRITYKKDIGRTYLIHAICSVPGIGRYEQTGRVVKVSNTRFTGRLYSDQYSVTGNVAISVSGSRQTISISSPNGTGRLTMSKR